MAKVARETRLSQLGHIYIYIYIYTEYPILQTESVTILYEIFVLVIVNVNTLVA